MLEVKYFFIKCKQVSKVKFDRFFSGKRRLLNLLIFLVNLICFVTSWCDSCIRHYQHSLISHLRQSHHCFRKQMKIKRKMSSSFGRYEKGLRNKLISKWSVWKRRKKVRNRVYLDYQTFKYYIINNCLSANLISRYIMK